VAHGKRARRAWTLSVGSPEGYSTIIDLDGANEGSADRIASHLQDASKPENVVEPAPDVTELWAIVEQLQDEAHEAGEDS
jgi:hypothetical protein